MDVDPNPAAAPLPAPCSGRGGPAWSSELLLVLITIGDSVDMLSGVWTGEVSMEPSPCEAFCGSARLIRLFRAGRGLLLMSEEQVGGRLDEWSGHKDRTLFPPTQSHTVCSTRDAQVHQWHHTSFFRVHTWHLDFARRRPLPDSLPAPCRAC